MEKDMSAATGFSLLFSIIILSETITDNFYYDFLLFRCDLVIAGQAESSVEQIRADVRSSAFYISIGSGSAVSFCRYERIHPVNGLQVHGLPEGSALRVIFGQCLQDFCRAGFSDSLI